MVTTIRRLVELGMSPQLAKEVMTLGGGGALLSAPQAAPQAAPRSKAEEEDETDETDEDEEKEAQGQRKTAARGDVVKSPGQASRRRTSET